VSLEATLLILRILIAVALYAFLAALFVMIWRDVRSAEAQPAVKGRPGRLIVVGSEGVPLELGQSFPLLPLTVLGRAPTCTVVLPDSFASTQHATLTLRGNQWWVEDQDSRNGTALNGQPIHEPVVLSSGDVIGIGRVELRVELG
jgi:hypothetical protein